MHTSDLRLDQCHRSFGKQALALAVSCLATAPRTQIDRVREAVLPVIANAWLTAMGQPSPMTGFALVVTADLGSCLLRLPAVRAAVIAAARSMAAMLAGLTLQMSAQRQVQAAPEASRPAFILQTLCEVKQRQAGPGYLSAGGRPQCNALHPPRRTS